MPPKEEDPPSPRDLLNNVLKTLPRHVRALPPFLEQRGPFQGFEAVVR